MLKLFRYFYNINFSPFQKSIGKVDIRHRRWSTKAIEDNTTAAPLNWQEWEHKVIGTSDEIKEALKALNRRPRNAAELEKIILDKREQEALKTLNEAEQGFKKYPW